MYNGLLAFRYKSGDLAEEVLGFGQTFEQMQHQAIDTTSGDAPAFKAMVFVAWVGFDYDTFVVSPTPSDAVSVTIEDPFVLECLGDAELFIGEGVTTSFPYSGLLAYQYKAGDLATEVLGLGSLVKQMDHQAIDATSGDQPAFKAMILMSWVGYDYDTDTVSPTPGDQICVTIIDPDDVNCLGDAAEFIGVGPATGGDVVGPASSTDNAIARFDGTTGKVIQNSVATVSDAGTIGTTIVGPGVTVALDITNTNLQNPAIRWQKASGDQGMRFLSGADLVALLQDNGQFLAGSFGTLGGMNITNFAVRRGLGPGVEFGGSDYGVSVNSSAAIAFTEALHKVVANLPAVVAMWIQGAAAQTADLLQFKNNAGTVLNSVNAAGNFSYAAAVPGDWVGAPPTTVNDAIDRIAAALGPIA